VKTHQALNIFLSQCLSAEGENPMVRHNPLSEWQNNSLSRPAHLYAADTVPNSEKLDVKGRFSRAGEEADVSKPCVIAELGSSGPLQRLQT
jgi:hypothetical protein